MDQILSRTFRYLWCDRDEAIERQRLKEEEEDEDVNAAEEKYVCLYEEEEEEEETYVQEEDVNAAVEKYVYIYDDKEEEDEEETYLEEEEDDETYVEEADEEGEEDVNTAVETYVYGMGEEEEEEEETVKAFVNAMAKIYEDWGQIQKNYPLGDPENFKITVTGVKWIKHYSSDYKILLVGEGDFSFSASLAAAFGSATNITATSLDSFEFLVRNYRNAVSNIVALKNYGATVLHGVDATKMANLYPFRYMGRFDRVVYNFPLAGFFPNQTREAQIRLNQTLVKLFLENAKKMIDINGEIHITHKCYGFYREWDLEALASRVGLRLREQVHFDLSDYPGYNTKYGFGGDKNFDCSQSKTYKFVHKIPVGT